MPKDRTVRLRDFKLQNSGLVDEWRDPRFPGLDHDVVGEFSDQRRLAVRVDVGDVVAAKFSVEVDLWSIVSNFLKKINRDFTPNEEIEKVCPNLSKNV